MEIERAIEILTERSRYVAEINIDGIMAYQLAIKSLEKQVFFENQVSNIRGWFIDNKECLLDTAQKVAKDGFVESCVSDFIDEVDLEFIVTDVVDEIHRGILNVLNTFKKDAQTQTEGDKK